jgi:phosphoribosyl-ATP pyrophosphohydrolase
MKEKLYKIYEYIRDNDEITTKISNTKKILQSLDSLEYCYQKCEEEKKEVYDASVGKHFHKGMTKREILVNEISQYMYWLIIIDVLNKVKYEDTDVFNKINTILELIDISKIEENEKITIEEVIEHDFESMRQKEYIREML